MFKCSFCFYLFGYLVSCVVLSMPESIANLRRENNDLKSKVSTLTEEISRLKDLFQQQSSRSEDDCVEVSRLIKLFNTLG